jgi:predicted GIY-YIG superfamily endonuclease
MQISTKDKKLGIYVIENIVNNKKYVGKSKNVYKRIHQHVSDILTLE